MDVARQHIRRKRQQDRNISGHITRSYPSRTIIHPKLEMTNPGDADEVAADVAAREVMSGKVLRKPSDGVIGGGGKTASSQMESQLNHLQGGGQTMPDGLRGMMEHGFDHDFSQVRLHTDDEAANLSSSINARAFTHGEDIYFNRGEYDPDTSEGQELMAHELAHVVQGGEKVGRMEYEDDNRDKKNSLISSADLLLLNMLTYLPTQKQNKAGVDIRNAFRKCIGKTVSYAVSYVMNLNPEEWGDETISSRDWSMTFDAILGNDRLQNLIIKATDEDSLGGFSVLFVDEQNKEAIVAFRGTTSKEWVDNFQGGGFVDQQSAPLENKETITNQQNAVINTFDKYFDSSLVCEPDDVPLCAEKKINKNDYTITVTGHSKGGNKAKFITLMDDSVDRCVSFDGQGFSDEFMEQYKDRINERGNLITNYNADKDFVNILLNDVGQTHYLFAQNYGTTSFFENHSPEVMLNFSMESGRTVAQLADEGVRSPIMRELDLLINNFLRNFKHLELPEESYIKQNLLNMLGEVIQCCMDPDNKSKIVAVFSVLKDKEKRDAGVIFLQYLADYFIANEEFRIALLGPDRRLADKFLVGLASVISELLGYEGRNKFEFNRKDGVDKGADLSSDGHVQARKVTEKWVKENPDDFYKLFEGRVKIHRSELGNLDRKYALPLPRLLEIAREYVAHIDLNKPERLWGLWDSAAQDHLDDVLKRCSKADRKCLKATFKELGLY